MKIIIIIVYQRKKYYVDCGNNGVLIADSIWNNSVNSEVQVTINSSATPYNSNMQFVYAAGNSAQNCGSSSLNDCNYFAAIFKGLKDAEEISESEVA